MVKHSLSRTHINRLTALARVSLVTLFAVFPTQLSCSSTPHTQSHFVKVADDRFGGEVEYLPNETETFLLCTNRPKIQPGNPQQPVRFVLFDVARNEVVFEDSLDNAGVRWLPNDRLEVRTIPEIVSEDGDTGSGYIFNTHTRTRTPIPVQRKERQ